MAQRTRKRTAHRYARPPVVSPLPDTHLAALGDEDFMWSSCPFAPLVPAGSSGRARVMSSIRAVVAGVRSFYKAGPVTDGPVLVRLARGAIGTLAGATVRETLIVIATRAALARTPCPDSDVYASLMCREWPICRCHAFGLGHRSREGGMVTAAACTGRSCMEAIRSCVRVLFEANGAVGCRCAFAGCDTPCAGACSFDVRLVDVHGTETWAATACTAHALSLWASWVLVRLPCIVYHAVRLQVAAPVDDATRDARIDQCVSDLCLCANWAWALVRSRQRDHA
jgi:hypothetical protein